MKKKGFTLIELLAVIVILAIIALIATPIILDVIDTAKKGSAESSALGYIDAVEKQIAISMVTSKDPLTNGNYNVSQLKNKKVEVKGKKPTDGFVKIEGNKVVDYSLKIDDYVCNRISDGKVECTLNGELSSNDFPIGLENMEHVLLAYTTDMSESTRNDVINSVLTGIDYSKYTVAISLVYFADNQSFHEGEGMALLGVSDSEYLNIKPIIEKNYCENSEYDCLVIKHLDQVYAFEYSGFDLDEIMDMISESEMGSDIKTVNDLFDFMFENGAVAEIKDSSTGGVYRFDK